MATQPYPGGTFPVQFYGGGVKRFTLIPNPASRTNIFSGGTVFGAGVLQNNNLFDSVLSYPYLGQHNLYNENKPVIMTQVGSGFGITKAVSNGTFASMVKGQYVMMTFNSQLSGNPTSVLSSPGSSYRKSQNVNIGWVNTVQINKTGGWYYNNGLPVNPLNNRDHIGVETYPGSYSVPGRLTFLATGKIASPQSYSGKSD